MPPCCFLLVSCCFDTGRPKLKNILWSGKWANCSDCIIFQERVPPLNIGDTEDSMNRYMLYSKSVRGIIHPQKQYTLPTPKLLPSIDELTYFRLCKQLALSSPIEVFSKLYCAWI